MIYDSDSATTGLGHHQNDSTRRESQQQVSPAGQLLGGGSEARARSSANQSSFIHSDSMDQEHESTLSGAQDNLATCHLSGLNSSNSILGRLNFWQPKEARGVTHLLARFRYARAQAPAARARRESFTLPIEREPPAGGDPQAASALEPNLAKAAPSARQIRHQVWLIGAANSSQLGQPLASLKVANSMEAQHLVDVDVETTLGKEFHLSGDKSIIGRQLRVTLSPNNASELHLASCTIVAVQQRLPADELDHLPSVSVVQPTREY